MGFLRCLAGGCTNAHHRLAGHFPLPSEGSAYGIGIETEAAAVEAPKPTLISSFDAACFGSNAGHEEPVLELPWGVFLAATLTPGCVPQSQRRTQSRRPL